MIKTFIPESLIIMITDFKFISLPVNKKKKER